MRGSHKKHKRYVSDAQRKAVHASKKDGGKGNPNKPKMVSPKSKLIKTKKGYSKNVNSESSGSGATRASAQVGGGLLAGAKKAANTYAYKYMKRGGHKALSKGKAIYNFISETGKGGFVKATGKLPITGAALGGAAASTAAHIGTKIAANQIQQGVARKRVEKFGQAGSAIIPNKKITGGSKVGDAIREGVRSYRGEKTFTHSSASDSRKSARAVRRQAKGKIYNADNIKPMTMIKPGMAYKQKAYMLKPKFLKGLMTKDDGSMTTFGNIANILGGGMIGQIKSGFDMFRGGPPAMHKGGMALHQRKGRKGPGVTKPAAWGKKK